MIDRIVTFSVERRWFILLMTLIAAAIGGWALSRLPIDAVPDITNNQVQINVRAPALSPELVEKQVSFPIETALAGTPGLEYTRSLSRNGFAQITARSEEHTSELQSLMRISYAVFCLNKKKTRSDTLPQQYTSPHKL